MQRIYLYQQMWKRENIAWILKKKKKECQPIDSTMCSCFSSSGFSSSSFSLLLASIFQKKKTHHFCIVAELVSAVRLVFPCDSPTSKLLRVIFLQIKSIMKHLGKLHSLSFKPSYPILIPYFGI